MCFLRLQSILQQSPLCRKCDSNKKKRNEFEDICEVMHNPLLCSFEITPTYYYYFFFKKVDGSDENMIQICCWVWSVE